MKIVKSIVSLVPEPKQEYKTPLKKRIKRSQFAKMISGFSDDEIKALTYCLILNPKIRFAIDTYSRAVDNYVQLSALQQEFDKRNIYLKKTDSQGG